MKKQKNKIKSSAVCCPEKDTLENKKIRLELVEKRLVIFGLMINIPLSITALIVAIDKMIS